MRGFKRERYNKLNSSQNSVDSEKAVGGGILLHGNVSQVGATVILF